MTANNLKHKFVWNATEFRDLKPGVYDHILALMNWDHMEYQMDKSDKNNNEPTLAEMTIKAIEILKRNPKGFYLLVEGNFFILLSNLRYIFKKE